MTSTNIPNSKGRIHYIKSWPTQFDAIKSGEKTFEWRKNDRDYAKGDVLVLKKFDPAEGGGFMPEQITVYVTYVMYGGFGLPDGYCIMSISHERPEDEGQSNG